MTPQVKTLLTHLQKHGSISQAEAGTVYKIRALPRRIADLKALGHKITRELKNDPTGQRYARYTLVTEEAPKVTPYEPVDAPIKALNMRPTVGDRVVVVRPVLSFGRYQKHSRGTVTALYNNESDNLHVTFDHRPSVSVLLFINEVEVITND